MLARPLWLCACLSALATLTSTAAVAGEVAVIDVDGVGLLPGSLDAINQALRAAVATREQVQDPTFTARFVKDAVAAGLSCSLSDDRCALQVGIAAGVDAVVVGHVVAIDDRWAIELRRVADGVPTRRAAGVLTANPASVGEVVARLAGAPTPAELRLPLRIAIPAGAGLVVDDAAVAVDDAARGVVWVSPGRHTVVARVAAGEVRVDVEVAPDTVPPVLSLPAPSTTTAPAPTSAAPSLWPAVALGAGSALAVVGGAGLAWSEVTLAAPMLPGAREVVEAVGRAGLVVGVVGVVGVGAGVVGLLLSPSDDATSDTQSGGAR